MVEGEPEYEVEMLLGKKVAEELVEVQPEDAVIVDEPQDEKAEAPGPMAPSGEEAIDVPVRRSARLASKPVSQPTVVTQQTRKPRRVRHWVTRYLVKWKGYGVEEATWERADNLRLHAQEAIDEYEYRQAQEGGEETVGVQCIHTLKREEDGSLSLQTVVVKAGGGGGDSAKTEGSG
jgi:hypothetical protein